MEIAESRGGELVLWADDDQRIFFDLIPELLCILDAEGRFRRTNIAWSGMLGYARDLLLSRSLFDFIHPEDSPASVLAFAALDPRTPVSDHVCRFMTADGEYRWLSWNAALLPDGKGVIASARDLSVRMELERKLEAAVEESERGNRAKSRFISTISHELRTPLNAVLGYAALLEDRPSDPKTASCLRCIRGSGNVLRDLINDILDLSKAESGRIALEAEPTDPRNMLAELAEVFRFDVEKKGIALSLRTGRSMPSMLLIDGKRLRQVLLNLVGNAVKFTERGSVDVLLEADPEGGVPAGIPAGDRRKSYKSTLLIQIRDTGIGMTAEYLQRLFEPFSQQDPGIHRTYGGTGLGLSISKRLLDLMDATIECESAVGSGSFFSISIPSVVSSGRERPFSLWIGAQPDS
ncbi:MAG: hypothetical protein A2413_16945 [Treponema sp. RIFOXYC1_FULL_61_9]|nr:MAG: hypothetical protein A2001_02530 [Treponema sp. GWC1_61_84]OHE71151.1 MAG: hypothetical protein A2413_16945 [Treponema sp. RIFOXYC1_FULL_61_9]